MWRALAIGLDGARVIHIFEGGDLGREQKTSGKKRRGRRSDGMSQLWYTPQSISLATAQIHPTKTTTYFHYRQNGFSPHLITSFGHLQDDGGIPTILIGEYVKLGSKGMQLTRNQIRRNKR